MLTQGTILVAPAGNFILGAITIYPDPIDNTPVIEIPATHIGTNQTHMLNVESTLQNIAEGVIKIHEK